MIKKGRKEELKKKILHLLLHNPKGLDIMFLYKYYFGRDFPTRLPKTIIEELVQEELVVSEAIILGPNSADIFYKITPWGVKSLV